MRRPRALADPGRPGLYHVCSRVVDRRVIFGDRERRRFMALIKGGAAFAGVEVVTWCLMGNHFHLLVRVPVLDAESFTDEETFARMEHIYSPQRMRHFRGIWERMGDDLARRGFLASFRARMGNLSDFVKTLKQRFTQWFNLRNNREGTLWEGRFHSVMLAHNESDDGGGLGVLARFVAGYIDLNPVRAKVVADAADSDWSGYGAALRGDKEGLEGVRILWGAQMTCDLSNEALLKLHAGMLERARFRDRERVDTEEMKSRSKGDRDASGLSLQVGVSGAESEGSFRMKLGEDQRLEARLFPQMGERCEDLTKGWALGGRWLASWSQ